MMDALRESIKSNRNMWLFIGSGAILVLATILRLWNLGAESAWIDEAYSIELAKHSFGQIIQGTAADQHPPLYYLLLNLWLRIGASIAHARLLSVLLGVISVGQILHFGYKTGGVFIGLIAGLLVALSPVHVWYSQEIRMYMLLLVLTTASTAVFWWALKSKRNFYWILYCLFSTLAIYTHYFALFIILAQAIWLVIWVFTGNSKNELWKWIASSSVTALLILPWLPTAINQARFHSMTWVESPSLAVIRDTLIRLLFGAAPLTLPDILLWLLLLSLLGILLWSFKFFLTKDNEDRSNYFFAVSWGIIPFIGISIIAMVYPVYQFKQYLIVLPALLLLYAWITYILPRSMRIIALVLIILSAGFSLIYQQVTLSKDNWRGAAEYIEQRTASGDIIYGNPAAASLALGQYAEISTPFSGIPGDYSIISGGWQGEMLTADSSETIFSRFATNFKRLWLVEFFPEFWDEGKTVEQWLESNSILLEEHLFGRIRIRLFAFN